MNSKLRLKIIYSVILTRSNYILGYADNIKNIGGGSMLNEYTLAEDEFFGLYDDTANIEIAVAVYEDEF